MSSPQSYNSPPSSSAPSPVRRGLTVAVRLLVAAVVLGVGFWTVTRLRSLLNDPSPLPIVEAGASATTDSTDPAGFDSLAASLVGGSWEFVDGGWSLGVGTLPAKDLTTYWSRTPPSTSPVGPVSAWERSVLDLIAMFHLTAEEAGAQRVYRRETPTMRAEIVALEENGVQRLVSARGVLQLTADEYATLETVCSGKSGGQTGSGLLLPYPAGTELLAVRTDARGTPLGEFSRSSQSLEQMQADWQAAGCRVTLNGVANDAEFREGICEHNGRALRIIFWEPRSQQGTTVLVLNASGADLSTFELPQNKQP